MRRGRDVAEWNAMSSASAMPVPFTETEAWLCAEHLPAKRDK